MSRYFAESKSQSEGLSDATTDNVFIIGANEIKNARNVQNKRRKKASKAQGSSLPELRGTKAGGVSQKKLRKKKKGDKGPDPFPGPAPLDPQIQAKYTNGPGVNLVRILADH